MLQYLHMVKREVEKPTLCSEATGTTYFEKIMTKMDYKGDKRSQHFSEVLNRTKIIQV